MNEFIFESVVNADVCVVINEIEYSTNPRKIVTVGDMVKHHRKQYPLIIKKDNELLKKYDLSSIYPTLIDERV